MFTRQHYEVIASTLWENKPTKDWPRPDPNWRRLVVALADKFQNDNPRFDRDRFYRRAGYSALEQQNSLTQ